MNRDQYSAKRDAWHGRAGDETANPADADKVGAESRRHDRTQAAVGRDNVAVGADPRLPGRRTDEPLG